MWHEESNVKHNVWIGFGIPFGMRVGLKEDVRCYRFYSMQDLNQWVGDAPYLSSNKVHTHNNDIKVQRVIQKREFYRYQYHALSSLPITIAYKMNFDLISITLTNFNLLFVQCIKLWTSILKKIKLRCRTHLLWTTTLNFF